MEELTINSVTEKKSTKTRINQGIKVKEVRLIDKDGSQVGIVNIKDALQRAQLAELDLVEISPNSDPPVCRIMDFGKYQYQQKKKLKKPKQIQVKELKYRPGTEEGDYQVKLRNLIRFLEHGDKVKITLRFRGRELAHQELGMKLLERIKIDLDEYAVVEQFPKMEGRQMVMVVSPKKKK